MLINVIFRALDYDFLPSHKYEFMVYAIDGGSPPLTGSATVQVGVISVLFSILGRLKNIFGCELLISESRRALKFWLGIIDQ